MPELKEFAVVDADPQGMHAQLPSVGALDGTLDGALLGELLGALLGGQPPAPPWNVPPLAVQLEQ